MIEANVFFDTCVYHDPGIRLLTEVIAAVNILMIGAVRGKDPNTGHFFGDTKRYVDQLPLSAADKQKHFEDKTRKVFARINKILGN
jgi:4-oxalmesaconate hydratase